MPVFYEPLYAMQASGGPSTISVLYIIDPNTGTGRRIGSTGVTRLGAMDFHPRTRQLFAVSASGFAPNDTELYHIDPYTAEVDFIGNIISDDPGRIINAVFDMSL